MNIVLDNQKTFVDDLWEANGSQLLSNISLPTPTYPTPLRIVQFVPVLQLKIWMKVKMQRSLALKQHALCW